jgi:ribosome biogenesis GTPase
MSCLENGAAMPRGKVIRLDTASCQVLCNGEALRCELPGLFRLKRRGGVRPIAVGDEVTFSRQETGDGRVETVEPRHGGILSRRAAGGRDVQQVVAANVDQLIVVGSLVEPPLNRRLLDRLIVSGEHGEMDAAVCINKADLCEAAAIEPVLSVYRNLGYPAVATSAVTGQGIEGLRELLRDRTSVLAGASGVGKSSLLMAVQPGLELRVGSVSESSQKGRHTTTAVRLLPLDVGGTVVDTPGIREFAVFDIQQDELKHYFPEMADRFGQCKFSDCSHREEPGCAVQAAVEAGEIDPERYESYLRIYETLPAPGDEYR